MKIRMIAFTDRGASLCSLLTQALNELGFEAIGFSKYKKDGIRLFEGSLKTFTAQAFIESDGIIFIGATGIAVRAIAPFITTKDKDPAVIVIDEFGEHIIPILSGHIGGANELAIKIAQIIKGKAIITTATDLNKTFAVDVWASRNDLFIENIQAIKYVSAEVLKGEKIGFACETQVVGNLPDFFTKDQAKVGIEITSAESKNVFSKTLILRPKVYFLGIGCRKNTNEEDLEDFVLETLKEYGIAYQWVKAVATIDIKANEEAINKLCTKYAYNLKTYTSHELSEVEGEFTASEFVKSIVGVDNVCERAAVLGSNHGNLILKKQSKNGMTIAIAMSEWQCRF
jgi:cobalt-precorrin 5A hydrolase